MFVRDKDRRTRGPGAIAAMDEASPNRRIAAAREERALARRDSIMALRTLGAVRGKGAATFVPSTSAPPPPPRRTTSSTVETGQEAAFSRPPPPPRPVRVPGKPLKIGIAQRGKFLVGQRPTIKLPGTVIEPPKTPLDAPKQGTTSTGAAAIKTQTVVVGSGQSWTAPKSATPVPEVPPMEPMNIPDVADPSGPAPAAAKPAKTQGNMLLYAALGVGVLWLLTRKD